MPAVPETMVIGDAQIEIVEQGQGDPILLLHGPYALPTEGEFVDRLAQSGRVVAPVHPGFGRLPLPDWLDTIDDLAYLYLDLIERRGLRNVTLVGLSIGGWIAAEIAVKCAHHLSRLVLVGSVGIKVGDREARDFPDIYALHPDKVREMIWHDLVRAPNPFAFSDDELANWAQRQETTALLVWEPYMHNPRLKRRLKRIQIPALYLRGAQDGFISQDYASAFAALLLDGRLDLVEGAAHVPELEQPRRLADKIAAFIRATAA